MYVLIHVQYGVCMCVVAVCLLYIQYSIYLRTYPCSTPHCIESVLYCVSTEYVIPRLGLRLISVCVCVCVCFYLIFVRGSLLSRLRVYCNGCGVSSYSIYGVYVRTYVCMYSTEYRVGR